MKSKYLVTFNFDYWRSLYQNSPLEFEEQRTNIIRNYIESCNNQRRLKGLQFRLDQERKLKKHPMGSCIHIHNLMMDKFYEEFVPIINSWNPKIK